MSKLLSKVAFCSFAVCHSTLNFTIILHWSKCQQFDLIPKFFTEFSSLHYFFAAQYCVHTNNQFQRIVLSLRRTSKFTPHCSTMGVNELPMGFWYITTFRKDFTFCRKPVMCSTRWGVYYGLRCWRGLWRHPLDNPLGFYPKLEMIIKWRNWHFYARRVYDIIKHFASFCEHFVLLSPKEVKNTYFSPKRGWPPATYDFSSSLIIHKFTSQSGYANLVRCVWFETPMKHWTEAFPR